MVQLNSLVLFDGQNLYRRAKDAWGIPDASGKLTNPEYSYPSYDVELLADSLTNRIPGRTLKGIRFYTGVPYPTTTNPDHQRWHTFWTNKLRYLKNKGVYIYKGWINMSGMEKGVDVSIAIDIIRLTYEKDYDVAIIVSQDHDLGPAVSLAKIIAEDQGRKLIFESCFPFFTGNGKTNRGIPGTHWIEITKTMYDACKCERDYRI